LITQPVQILDLGASTITVKIYSHQNENVQQRHQTPITIIRHTEYCASSGPIIEFTYDTIRRIFEVSSQ
jgi:hypothetical protein